MKKETRKTVGIAAVILVAMAGIYFVIFPRLFPFTPEYLEVTLSCFGEDDLGPLEIRPDEDGKFHYGWEIYSWPCWDAKITISTPDGCERKGDFNAGEEFPQSIEVCGNEVEITKKSRGFGYAAELVCCTSEGCSSTCSAPLTPEVPWGVPFGDTPAEVIVDLSQVDLSFCNNPCHHYQVEVFRVEHRAKEPRYYQPTYEGKLTVIPLENLPTTVEFKPGEVVRVSKGTLPPAPDSDTTPTAETAPPKQPEILREAAPGPPESGTDSTSSRDHTAWPIQWGQI